MAKYDAELIGGPKDGERVTVDGGREYRIMLAQRLPAAYLPQPPLTEMPTYRVGIYRRTGRHEMTWVGEEMR